MVRGSVDMSDDELLSQIVKMNIDCAKASKR